MNGKEATKTIRVTQATKTRIDRTIIIKGETYDKILNRLLSEERHLPALSRAYTKAVETTEAFKKCESTNPSVKGRLLQQSKSANEYLMTLIRNFIETVEAR